MEKLKILQDDTPSIKHRFRKIYWASQLAMVGGVLNILFFTDQIWFADSLFGVRLDMLALALGVVVSFYSYRILRRGESILAGVTYLWLSMFVAVLVTWLEGGLYSLIILSFPIILICGSLFTSFRVFLGISGFLTLMVLLMGLNHIYDWYPAPEGMFITGRARLLSGLIIIVLTSYVAWTFGELLKISMSELVRENLRATKSQQVAKKLAEYDSLTGLLNRQGGKDIYDATLQKLGPGERLAFYFIDLDNFKNINDLFDHHEGDRLLVEIANRLSILVEDKGASCRLGGDEFILFIREDEHVDFDNLAKNLIAKVAQPHDIYGTEVEITASVGVSVISQKDLSFDDARKQADMAMYRAKQSGKNQYHYYSDELSKEYMRNLNIVTGLKDAVARGLLDLHFQPKVNFKQNRIECTEALLRWTRDNPEGIRPDEFIPVIESTELIHSVGEWVIWEACRFGRHLHDMGFPLKISVNVAAMQLTRPELYGVIVDALETTGLPPKAFEIELTEHFLLNENLVVESQINALKKLGVSLAIDDFGTGYSNMGYLTRLKVDILKLDRSFISQIVHSKDSLVIVTAVIKMAQVLGMKVVAEGIEHEEERVLLADLDCDYGQGYFWSKPLATEEFIGLLIYLAQGASGVGVLTTAVYQQGQEAQGHIPSFPKGGTFQPASG